MEDRWPRPHMLKGAADILRGQLTEGHLETAAGEVAAPRPLEDLPEGNIITPQIFSAWWREERDRRYDADYTQKWATKLANREAEAKEEQLLALQHARYINAPIGEVVRVMEKIRAAEEAEEAEDGDAHEKQGLGTRLRVGSEAEAEAVAVAEVDGGAETEERRPNEGER